MFRMFMVTMATCGYHEHALRSPIGDPVPLIRCTPPTPAPSPEGCTNSDGPSDWATDHSPMLFVHGRMVRHRSDGLSMSQVSVSDMDPLVQISCPKHPDRPLPPTPTHPSQHTGHSPPPPGEADRWHYVMR